MMPKVYHFMITLYHDPAMTVRKGTVSCNIVARNRAAAFRRLDREIKENSAYYGEHMQCKVLEKSWLKSVLALIIPGYYYETDKRWEEQ